MKKINSNWMAGFIDGDGSFALEKVGNFYRPVLSIAQNDPSLLHKIKDFFGCGTVTKKSSSSWHYRCRSTEQFQKYIIPKLGKAPFQTVKQYQYDIICHEAMPLLTNTFSSTSPSREASLQICLEKIRQSRKTDYVNTGTPINEDWFWGFFEAEGHLSLRVSVSCCDSICESQSKRVPRIFIGYKVTQKSRALLEKILDFFRFGNIHSEGLGRCLKYSVEGVQNVCQYGLPLLMKNPFYGNKNLQRIKFIKALRILSSNLNQPGGTSKSYNSKEKITKLKKLADEIVKLRKM